MTRSRGARPLRALLSYLWAQRLAEVASDVHPRLAVRIVSGRLRLDAARVNHSGGKLRDAWAQAFEAVRPEQRSIERVLLLGLGGGSALELLRERGVRAHVDAVELDPVVVRLAREHFGIDALAPLSIHVADALAWVAQPGPRYDLVLVDLFVEDEMPAGSRDEPFLRALAARLVPGGVLLVNQLALSLTQIAAARRCQGLAERVLGPSRLVACATNLVLVHESLH